MNLVYYDVVYNKILISDGEYNDSGRFESYFSLHYSEFGKSKYAPGCYDCCDADIWSLRGLTKAISVGTIIPLGDL